MAFVLSLRSAALTGCVVYEPEPATGLIRGAKDGIDVSVVVARQADGSVRVHSTRWGRPSATRASPTGSPRRTNGGGAADVTVD